MKKTAVVLAKAGDERLIHEMKYTAFLPLYERYKDDATNPAVEPIEKVTAQIKSKDSDYYIVTFDSKPVGAVRVVKGVENGERVYRISPLFIIPEYQNKGIGKSVINMIIETYGQAGIWRLSAVKQEKNTCRFYEKCGFGPIGGEVSVNDKMTIQNYEKRV